jgi:hypothetical protein
VISPLISLYLAVVESPGATGTEKFFRGFWDRNIKDVIELVLQQGQSIRYGNDNTQTRNMRPDFGLLVKTCAFSEAKKRGRRIPKIREPSWSISLCGFMSQRSIYLVRRILANDWCELLIASPRLLLPWTYSNACCDLSPFGTGRQAHRSRFSICKFEASSRSHCKYTAIDQFVDPSRTSVRPFRFWAWGVSTYSGVKLLISFWWPLGLT